jgi:hypothetical protein
VIATDLREVLRPADVLLVGRRGGISDVIRAVTHSQYSHVAMIDQTAGGIWIVLEATTDVRGVAGRRLEVITDDPTVEHLALLELNSEDGLTDHQRMLITDAAWLHTGEKYSNLVNLEILNHIAVDAHEGYKSGENCALMVAVSYLDTIALTPIDVARPTPEAWHLSPLMREKWSSSRA